MEDIFETNSEFDFNKVVLLSPTASSGNHFIKFSINESPLYIQPPKCKTKHGFTKVGKKTGCELLFTNENDSFIQWMENLETYCYSYIYKNREQWFNMEMEMQDIENYFISPLKTYKSGTCYVLKSHVPVLGTKIYDENETDVDPSTILENTNVITILEVQGIRCSARSFQIEIILKQMMILNPVTIFEKCIIKKETFSKTEPIAENAIEIANIEIEDPEPEEFKIDLEQIQETVQIKQRSDIYYKMYLDAKTKAKLAKDFALSAYLEAKRIKNTYLLDIPDSDEEIEV